MTPSALMVLTKSRRTSKNLWSSASAGSSSSSSFALPPLFLLGPRTLLSPSGVGRRLMFGGDGAGESAGLFLEGEGVSVGDEVDLGVVELVGGEGEADVVEGVGGLLGVEEEGLFGDDEGVVDVFLV